MRPYFSRWRSKANKLASKELAQEASSKFMTRTKKYRSDEKTEKLLRNKFNKWRKNAKDLTNAMKKNIPDALEHLKKHNIKTNAPKLLENLKK